MSVIRTENLTYTYSQGTPFEKKLQGKTDYALAVEYMDNE